jgi:cysteine-S-conjugate beta-lyase
MDASNSFDFDTLVERRGTASVKWDRYKGRDILPMWVADMDFKSPPAVVRALCQRAEEGVFGYTLPPERLGDVIVARLAEAYGWQVAPEWLVWLPGLVTGLNVACRAVGEDFDAVMTAVPVYPPFLSAPGFSRRELITVPLKEAHLRWTFDFDRLEAMITDKTRLFILCNPHNPVGRVFSREELHQLAVICQRHDIVICSDEIHCDLVFDGHEHISIASLSPEVERRTITLIAPSKTYNIAGIHASVAIITDPDLRQRFEAARAGLVPRLGVLGNVAMLSAYRDGEAWLEQAMAYMQANRDFLYDYVNSWLPGITMARPEGTYLAWLDCRGADLPGNPHKFFLEEAGVALNDGATFGKGGEGFVRLNFACPRATLERALEQMREALG